MKLEATWQPPQFFALSSDDRFFACVGDKQKIHVYDRDRAEPVWRLDGHKEDALCGAFSLDGAILATGGMDKSVRLWNLKTGGQQDELKRHDGSVLAVCFLPDRKTLTSLSRDRICLWNWADGKFLREFKVRGTSIIGMAVSAHGDHLAGFCHGGTIIVWDLATGSVLHPVEGHRACVNSLVFSPDGKTLVSGGDDAVFVWDISKQKIQNRVETPAERLAFLPQSIRDSGSHTKLMVANFHRTPELWDISLDPPAMGHENLPGSKLLRSFKGPTNTNGMRLSPDGKFVAAQPWRPHDSKEQLPAAYIWDVEKGELCGQTCLAPVAAYFSNNSGIAFSADGKLLATGGVNNPIQLSSVPDGKLVREIDQSTTGLAFSPDGGILASLDMGQATFFEPATGKKLSTFGKRLGHGIGREWPIAFSPDGRTLAVAAEDGIIRLCEISTGWERGEFNGHQGKVYALAFSPDGNSLVFAGEDTTILVWNLTGGKVTSVKTAWAVLASDNGRDAYSAIHSLVESPKDTLAYVKDRMPPLRAVEPAQLRKLFADLGSLKFSVREQATRELEMMQELPVSAMQKALDSKPELEVCTRLEALLQRVNKDHLEPGSERLRWIRVLEVLERIRTPEALDIVRILAGGPDEMRVSIEARSVLRRWPKQP